MRIAVCFFGITRNFATYTLGSIERNLFETVASRDPQFRKLAHFNRLADVSNSRTGENKVSMDPEEYKLLRCDVVGQTDQEEVGRQIDFDYIKQFGDPWCDGFNSLKNLLRQFYSLNAVTELLLREKDRFDVVIFSRADLRFETQVEIPRIHPRTLYTPWFQAYHGLNDRFALGDFETMVAYGSRQCMIRQYCLETRRSLNAEDYLLWYVRKRGLHSQPLTSMNFSRVRSNGVVLSVNSSPREKWKCRFKRGLQKLGLRSY
jgi:hypothetical protein